MTRFSATESAVETLHQLESYGMAFRQLPRAMFVGANNFIADGLFNQCAAISYYALLSVPAFISLLAALLGYVLGSEQQGMEAALDRISQLVPDMPEQIREVAASFIEYRGAIGLAALLVSLWIAHLVFAAVGTAVAQIFRRPVQAMDWRHFALRALWAWARPFLMFFAATVLLVASFVLQNITSVLHSFQAPWAQQIIAFADASGLVTLATSLITGTIVFGLILQALTPQILSLRILLPSAIVGSLLWEVAEQLLGSYLRYAATVRNFTGSVGAVVIFMVWIYYAATVLLYSLEVAAALAGDRSLYDNISNSDTAHTL
ncbi:MAG: YihY/virulence factor BrkB family protein [Acidobacteriota bacterium]|jgi:membrane protein